METTNDNFIGRRFGRLVVMCRVHGTKKWECQCDCGIRSNVLRDSLVRGATKSCGCLHREVISERLGMKLEGRTFGRLTVIFCCGTRNARKTWKCKCSCGTECVRTSTALVNQGIKSCGCLQRETIAAIGRSAKRDITWTKSPRIRPIAPNRRTSIYCLVDPVSRVVRYIGKTGGKLSRRLSGHIGQSRRNGRTGSTYTYRWIRSLTTQGKFPTIRLIEECDGDGRVEEVFHIRLARTDGLKITNSTDGGEECGSGPLKNPKPRTEEWTRKIVEGNKRSARAKSGHIRRGLSIRKFSPEKEIEIAKEYLRGDEIKDICSRNSCSEAMFLRLLKRNGVIANRRGTPEHKKKMFQRAMAARGFQV